jgi:hypothetical protein
MMIKTGYKVVANVTGRILHQLQKNKIWVRQFGLGILMVVGEVITIRVF